MSRGVKCEIIGSSGACGEPKAVSSPKSTRRRPSDKTQMCDQSLSEVGTVVASRAG